MYHFHLKCMQNNLSTKTTVADSEVTGIKLTLWCQKSLEKF